MKRYNCKQGGTMAYNITLMLILATISSANLAQNLDNRVSLSFQMGLAKGGGIQAQMELVY